MSGPRLVAPGELGVSLAFADTARAALERVLAKGAIALVIIYETANTYAAEPVPPSSALTVGLIHEYVTATSPGDD